MAFPPERRFGRGLGREHSTGKSIRSDRPPTVAHGHCCVGLSILSHSPADSPELRLNTPPSPVKSTDEDREKLHA